ncbi:MAG: zinc-binding alcohol dehydrogenase [Candidatus Nanopelagicales bacterium]
MRSLQISFPRPRQVELLERDVPEPGRGEVRCRALASLVSTGTESFCLDGTFDPGTFWEEWVQYPFAPGYSMTSQVVDIGSDVTGIAVGDRVATSTPHQSVFIVPATECVVVPDAVTSEQACWASLACTTQLGVRRAELKLGESAAVVGLGVLGQLVVQYLRLSGARHIIAIEPGRSRASLARDGGATEVITAQVGVAMNQVREITGGAMVDVAFDITGHADVLAPTTRLVHQLGRVVLLGDTPTPSRQQLGPRIVADSVSILGVHASAAPETASLGDPWTLPAMTSLFFDWVSSGRMDVDSLVTHRFVPGQAAEVYESLRTDRSSFLGTILDWTQVAT